MNNSFTIAVVYPTQDSSSVGTIGKILERVANYGDDPQNPLRPTEWKYDDIPGEKFKSIDRFDSDTKAENQRRKDIANRVLTKKQTLVMFAPNATASLATNYTHHSGLITLTVNITGAVEPDAVRSLFTYLTQGEVKPVFAIAAPHDEWERRSQQYKHEDDSRVFQFKSDGPYTPSWVFNAGAYWLTAVDEEVWIQNQFDPQAAQNGLREQGFTIHHKDNGLVIFASYENPLDWEKNVGNLDLATQKFFLKS